MSEFPRVEKINHILFITWLVQHSHNHSFTIDDFAFAENLQDSTPKTEQVDFLLEEMQVNELISFTKENNKYSVELKNGFDSILSNWVDQLREEKIRAHISISSYDKQKRHVLKSFDKKQVSYPIQDIPIPSEIFTGHINEGLNISGLLLMFSLQDEGYLNILDIDQTGRMRVNIVPEKLAGTANDLELERVRSQDYNLQVRKNGNRLRIKFGGLESFDIRNSEQSELLFNVVQNKYVSNGNDYKDTIKNFHKATNSIQKRIINGFGYTVPILKITDNNEVTLCSNIRGRIVDNL